jgi:hypothetical protein
VIGVNAAYIDGFSGGTLGVSVRALKPLIETAKAAPAKTPTVPQEYKSQANAETASTSR